MSETWISLLSQSWWPMLPAGFFLLGCVLGGLIFWLQGAKQARHDHAVIVRLEAELDAERRIGKERERAFDDAKDSLEASFSLLSGEALKRNTSHSFRSLMLDSESNKVSLKAI